MMQSQLFLDANPGKDKQAKAFPYRQSISKVCLGKKLGVFQQAQQLSVSKYIYSIFSVSCVY